ncbi:hypothetical protein [Parafrankia sp. EUN1f]|uniref:hypothetical protein n=1 Tax=Parafrankia sp. EUN1f TaxID=102897 RepID=UPI0001C44E12|nr:hypothetical protein [Parafrankia sp. EUN1f]EFC84069.1 hypothetical protein FrEUN1fDRAFT_2795 [Parafrankia sp. EUN1f]
MCSIPPTGPHRPDQPHPDRTIPAPARPAAGHDTGRRAAGVPVELLTPTPVELDRSRARLARVRSLDVAIVLGIETSSRLGSIVGGLVRGDVDWVAENLRHLLALDQASRAEGRL